MKLLEQLIEELGGDTSKSFTVVPAFGGYFRSVRSVAEFSPEKVVLLLKRFAVIIRGENLQVGKYFEGDVLIKGTIRGVEIE